MKSDDFESRMRALEYFHSLRVLDGTWPIIRVDGHGFSRFTERKFEKPFDLKFHELMVKTAQAILEQMHGLYAYTESDEISILFRPDWDLFDRELEKLVSLSAGIASATFTHHGGTPAHFDSRVWLGVTQNNIIDYFRWRQSDATRCALNGWCYWTLRKDGKTVKEATSILKGQSIAFKNELLFQHDINFNELPLWQRRGTGLYWHEYEKEGYNPIEKKTVITKRRSIKIDQELPMKDDYEQFLVKLLVSATSK